MTDPARDWAVEQALDWLSGYSYPDHLNENMVSLLAAALRAAAEEGETRGGALWRKEAENYAKNVDYWREKYVTGYQRGHEAGVREEREACAKLCSEIVWMRAVEWWLAATKHDVSKESAYQCASAIRARERAIEKVVESEGRDG